MTLLRYGFTIGYFRLAEEAFGIRKIYYNEMKIRNMGLFSENNKPPFFESDGGEIFRPIFFRDR